MSYCPGCGGAFPDSSKRIWVPLLPQGELDSVHQLAADLKDAEQIIARLGPPDYDSTTVQAGGIATAGAPEPVRNIEYYNLSTFLDLQFYIHGDYPPSHVVVIKPLPARHQKDVEPGGRPNDDSATASSS